jgi:hypothetical protein
VEGRIVISFRATRVSAQREEGRSFLERARALVDRAAESGGELVAWDGTRLAVAFPGSAIAEAVTVAIANDSLPTEEPWAIGMAQG